MKVRLLVDEDRAAWNPLWQGYLEFYQVDLAADVTELTWRRLLDPGEPMCALGLFADGKLIGFAHLVFHRSTWSAGPYCYLEDLYVDKDRRGKGAGRILIEAAAQGARGAGATQLYWLTHETNQQAMALYDKVAKKSGFLHYQRKLES
jgi:GNAT superfamily N-acetyltransferase